MSQQDGLRTARQLD